MTRNKHGFTADTDIIITIAIDFYHEAKTVNSLILIPIYNVSNWPD